MPRPPSNFGGYFNNSFYFGNLKVCVPAPAEEPGCFGVSANLRLLFHLSPSCVLESWKGAESASSELDLVRSLLRSPPEQSHTVVRVSDGKMMHLPKRNSCNLITLPSLLHFALLSRAAFVLRKKRWRGGGGIHQVARKSLRTKPRRRLAGSLIPTARNRRPRSPYLLIEATGGVRFNCDVLRWHQASPWVMCTSKAPRPDFPRSLFNFNCCEPTRGWK